MKDVGCARALNFDVAVVQEGGQKPKDPHRTVLNVSKGDLVGVVAEKALLFVFNNSFGCYCYCV